MSAPSTLAPWFVVFKEGTGELTYYQSDYSDDKDEAGMVYTFSPHKGGALLFQNLASAARVAKTMKGMIRALVTEEEAKEFNRT